MTLRFADVPKMVLAPLDGRPEADWYRAPAGKWTCAQIVEHLAISLEYSAVTFDKRRAHDSMVRLCVQDNGIGIKPEYFDKLFQPFVRLANGAGFPGTGIGLAIVRKGVERMGGRVGVDSEPGKGSCFWIELPAASSNSSSSSS